MTLTQTIHTEEKELERVVCGYLGDDREVGVIMSAAESYTQRILQAVVVEIEGKRWKLPELSQEMTPTEWERILRMMAQNDLINALKTTLIEAIGK